MSPFARRRPIVIAGLPDHHEQFLRLNNGPLEKKFDVRSKVELWPKQQRHIWAKLTQRLSLGALPLGKSTTKLVAFCAPVSEQSKPIETPPVEVKLRTVAFDENAFKVQKKLAVDIGEKKTPASVAIGGYDGSDETPLGVIVLRSEGKIIRILKLRGSAGTRPESVEALWDKGKRQLHVLWRPKASADKEKPHQQTYLITDPDLEGIASSEQFPAAEEKKLQRGDDGSIELVDGA